MLRRLGLLVFLAAVVSVPGFAQESADEPPPEYVSDGCSWFPDGNYRDCCVAHDKDYYKGGTCKQRRESDNRLYQCVRSKKRWYNKLVAPIMWAGVRVFGTSLLPTPFKWGFGKTKQQNKEVENDVTVPAETVDPPPDKPEEPPLNSNPEPPVEASAEPPAENPVDPPHRSTEVNNE